MFKADAVSMYTNIDTEHGLNIINDLLTTFELAGLLPNAFPKELLLKFLHLIMTHNAIQFGPSYWLQTSGTAMGTNVACSYATLYFGWLEVKVLLTRFQKEIIILKRLIDDMFCLWKGSTKRFEEFKQITNSFGHLKWEFSSLIKNLDYLDLTLTLNNGYINTKTFEKKHNLYLYIPYSSSHSPNCKKSLIYSLCYRYYHLNNQDEDYVKQVHKLYLRLLKRGYPPQNTRNIIIEATIRLQATKKCVFTNISHSTNPNSSLTSLDRTLIFKTTFHKSINKRYLKKLFNKNFTFQEEPESNFNFIRTIIA